MDEKDPQATGTGTAAQSRRIELLLDVPLELSVELGRTRMSIQELLSLGPGSVIELDKVAGEPLDILVNNRLVARGEAVVVNDKFGIRITDILKPAEGITPLASGRRTTHE